MKSFHVDALGLVLCGLGLFVTAPALAQADAVDGADAPAAADEPAAKAPKATLPAPPAEPAESTRAPNSVYAEGLGAGLAYSINYERLVLEDLGVRAGFSYLSFSSSVGTSAGSASASATFITIPVTVSYLGVGNKHHILELGGGMSFLYAGGSASGLGVSSSGSGMTVLPDALIGYRLHPVDGAGFMFRVGAMVFAGKGFDSNDPSKFGLLPWGYLSLGASF